MQAYVYMHTRAHTTHTYTGLCDSISMWEAKNLSTGTRLAFLLTEQEWKLNKV